MQEADHLTIELFLTNEEQVDYLKNHTPPRLRPASWKDVDELSPSDQSELLHMATMLQEFESSHRANMLMAIGAEMILGCKGELITLTEQYTDRSFIMLDVGAYISKMEDKNETTPSKEDLLVIQEWIALSPYKLYMMTQDLIYEIDQFFSASFLHIASGRGFDVSRERELSGMWEEKVLEWAVDTRQKVREGIFTFVPSPFEEEFISFSQGLSSSQEPSLQKPSSQEPSF
jgi:hypothetical protein